MSSFTFTVHLDRVPDDAEQDELFDAGLDDGNVIIDGGRASVLVTRPASSVEAALVEVLAEIRSVGLDGVGIDNEDLVDLATIARRTGRSHESIRLLSLGRRWPGGFPAAVAPGVYSWGQVRVWFADQGTELPADAEADSLAAADLMLRARALRPHPGELIALLAG